MADADRGYDAALTVGGGPALDPTVNRPTSTSSIPPEWTTRFKAANPGASDVDAVKSFLLLPDEQRRSWMPAPAPPAAGSGAETSLEAAKQRVYDSWIRPAVSAIHEYGGDVVGAGAYGIDRLIRPVMQSLPFSESYYTPFDSLAQAQEKAKTSPLGVPDTLTGQVLMVAGPKISSLPVKQAAAVGAVTGAGASELEGRNPVTGAVEGAATGVVPKVIAAPIKAATSLVQKWAGVGAGETPAIRAATEQAAGNFADSMRRDVPELHAALSGNGSMPQQIAELTGGPGQKALSGMIENTENQVTAALPTVRIQLPQPAGAPSNIPPWLQAAAARDPRIQAQLPPGAGGQTLGLKDAFRELQNLKDTAYDLRGEGNLRDFRAAKAHADALEQNILTQIRAVDPRLAEAWQAATTRYAFGKRYLDLAKTALAGQTAAGTPWDPAALAREYLTNADRYGILPSRAGLFGGGELGTSPTTSSVGVPATLHAPGLGPANIYARGPAVNFLTQPGRRYGVDVLPIIAPSIGGTLGSFGSSDSIPEAPPARSAPTPIRPPAPEPSKLEKISQLGRRALSVLNPEDERMAVLGAR